MSTFSTPKFSTPEFIVPAEEDLASFAALFAQSSLIGATAGGGLHRLAASEEDGQVRDLLCTWLTQHGFDVRVDAVGNIFGLFTFDADAPYVLCGSHLDSQPSAGRFDGVYGVLAAAVAIGSLARQMRARGDTPSCNLCVVNWTNEEGARFQPSLTGSSVYTGAMTLDQALACRDAQGVSLQAALAKIGYLGTWIPDLRVAAYAEIHVEQGAGLESKGLAIGVVRETWAALKWRVRFDGEQNHTGPTPMAQRRDALLAAAHAIAAVRAAVDPHGLAMHSSVGRMDIYPNSPNVVASRATLMIEFRSQSVELLQETAERFQLRLEEIARGTRTSVEVEDKTLRSPLKLDHGLSELAHDTAVRLGMPVADSVTVAGHDAISMSRVYPTCLVFVPSSNGVSHNESEFTAEHDLQNGLYLLTALLYRICTQPVTRR